MVELRTLERIGLILHETMKSPGGKRYLKERKNRFNKTQDNKIHRTNRKEMKWKQKIAWWIWGIALPE